MSKKIENEVINEVKEEKIEETTESKEEKVVETTESKEEKVVETTESKEEKVVETTESKEEKVVETTELEEEKVEKTTESKEEKVVETTELEEEKVEKTTESKEEKKSEKKKETKKPKKEENNSDKTVKEDKKDNIEDNKTTAKQKLTLFGICVGVILLVSIVIYVSIIGSKPTTTTHTNDITKQQTASDKVNLETIKEAAKKLKENDKYIIWNYMDSAASIIAYVDYVSPEYSATFIDLNNTDVPYPLIEDGTSNFIFSDLTKDNMLYLFNPVQNYDTVENENGTTGTVVSDGNDKKEVTYDIYTTYESYAKSCKQKDTMFIDLILDNVYGLKFKGTSEYDIGYGSAMLDVYEGTLSANASDKIMGYGTIGLYEEVLNNCKDDPNMTKFITWVKEDNEFSSKFNEAKILIGINTDGMLSFMTFEFGGLGTRMYYTKSVVLDTTAFDTIEIPDLTGATPYIDNYNDYASMAPDFDSLEDLMTAINNMMYGNTSFTDEQLQEILNNAIQDAQNDSDVPITSDDFEATVISEEEMQQLIENSENASELYEQNNTEESSTDEVMSEEVVIETENN